MLFTSNMDVQSRCFILLILSIKVTESLYPFQDPSLPWDKRVNDLVSRLTLEEIVEQLAKGGAGKGGPAPAIPRLGVLPHQWNTECLRGVAEAGNATSFPQALGLSAAFRYFFALGK